MRFCDGYVNYFRAMRECLYELPSLIPHCCQSTGKIKVCNGNYGETKWRGINIIEFENGFMSYSVAKMNEYYLDYDGDDAKQYTICHGKYSAQG